MKIVISLTAVVAVAAATLVRNLCTPKLEINIPVKWVSSEVKKRRIKPMSEKAWDNVLREMKYYIEDENTEKKMYFHGKLRGKGGYGISFENRTYTELIEAKTFNNHPIYSEICDICVSPYLDKIDNLTEFYAIHNGIVKP